MIRRCVYLALAVIIGSGVAFAESNYSYNQQVNYGNYTQPQTNYTQQTHYNNAETVMVEEEQQPMYAQSNTLRGSVVTVPAGQCFNAVVTTPVSSSTMFRGQNVSMALASNFYYNGMLIAPA